MPEPVQDYDKNGDRSNSYTREAARQELATSKGLTSEQRQLLENQTQCRTESDRQKADKSKLKE